MLLSRDFDVVIAGHHPPDIDAAELVREVGGPNIIIAQTGAKWPFEREYFYSLGARAVLSRWEPEIAKRITQVVPAADDSEVATRLPFTAA